MISVLINGLYKLGCDLFVKYFILFLVKQKSGDIFLLVLFGDVDHRPVVLGFILHPHGRVLNRGSKEKVYECRHSYRCFRIL